MFLLWLSVCVCEKFKHLYLWKIQKIKLKVVFFTNIFYQRDCLLQWLDFGNQDLENRDGFRDRGNWGRERPRSRERYQRLSCVTYTCIIDLATK